MQKRRSHLRILYDMIQIISNDRNENGTGLKITKLQQRSNISFDKIENRIEQLKKNGFVTTNPYTVTEKGFWFMHKYEIILELENRLQNDIIRDKFHKIKLRKFVFNQNLMNNMEQIMEMQKDIMNTLKKLQA